MKKFLVIGNANAITYKEVFPSIANGEIFVRTAKGTVCFVMYFTKEDGENTYTVLLPTGTLISNGIITL